MLLWGLLETKWWAPLALDKRKSAKVALLEAMGNESRDMWEYIGVIIRLEGTCALCQPKKKNAKGGKRNDASREV